MSLCVSIIIPAFNSARYIAETITSVLGQSWQNLQVVVVDDGSSDNTVEIARSFEDPRVLVIEAEHCGAAAARNIGFKSAIGEYIQYLDADDLLSAEKLELQINALSRTRNSKTIASCAWLKFEESIEQAVLKPEEVWTVEDPAEWLICSLSGGGMMQTGAWLVRRDLIEAAGPWDEALTLHDDGEFFARVLLEAERQVFVPEAKVYYRNVAGSLSRKRSRQAIDSAFSVCQSRDKHLLGVRDDQCTRQAIATQYAQFLYEFSFEAPDLNKSVTERMVELGAKPKNVVGGKTFCRLVATVGFSAAMAVRQKAVKLSRGPVHSEH